MKLAGLHPSATPGTNAFAEDGEDGPLHSRPRGCRALRRIVSPVGLLVWVVAGGVNAYGGLLFWRNLVASIALTDIFSPSRFP